MRGMLASADRGWHCRRRALVEGWYVRRCGRCRSATHCQHPARRSTVAACGNVPGAHAHQTPLAPKRFTVGGTGKLTSTTVARLGTPWRRNRTSASSYGWSQTRRRLLPSRDFTVQAPDLGSVGVRRGCPGGWRCADPEGRGGLHRDALRLTPRCRQSIATALLPVGARAHSGAGHFPCNPRPATAEARAARSAVRAPLVTGNQSPRTEAPGGWLLDAANPFKFPYSYPEHHETPNH